MTSYLAYWNEITYEYSCSPLVQRTSWRVCRTTQSNPILCFQTHDTENPTLSFWFEIIILVLEKEICFEEKND
jgi:hypothetical protein